MLVPYITVEKDLSIAGHALHASMIVDSLDGDPLPETLNLQLDGQDTTEAALADLFGFETADQAIFDVLYR